MQSIHWIQENKQPQKSLSEKYVHIQFKKDWVSHILFVEKRGPIIYLAALKKGVIRHAYPYYAIYRTLHPPPLAPTPLPHERIGFLFWRKPTCFNKKITTDPFFSWQVYERPHFSDIQVYAHIFRLEVFRGSLISRYSLNWLQVQTIKGQLVNM